MRQEDAILALLFTTCLESYFQKAQLRNYRNNINMNAYTIKILRQHHSSLGSPRETTRNFH